MKARFTDEQIIAMIKEQEAGEKTADVCRRHGISSATWLCCTNRTWDSLYESSVIAERHEQLGPDEVQDQELAFV